MSEVLEGPVPRQDCQMRLVGDVQVRFPTLPPAEPRLCLPGLQGSPLAAWRRLSDFACNNQEIRSSVGCSGPIYCTDSHVSLSTHTPVLSANLFR